MAFWTAVVLLALIAAFTVMYVARLKTVTDEPEEKLLNLHERMERIEERVANLETVVLEREKSKEFSEI